MCVIPVVGAGTLDIRMDEVVNNMTNTSSIHARQGLNPPQSSLHTLTARFPTTDMVHDSFSALMNPRSPVNSMTVSIYPPYYLK